MQIKHTNRLIDSTSPYLLQHAHNPVDWRPWSSEAFQFAKENDRPVIVSIGYSACHWCHVMEKECFENEDIAKIMNDHFVCIKVDREERPDVDQIYMEALQTMGLQGGWPLNVFVTADQKPFYGGTYFPPAQWRQVLLGIANAYQENREQLIESAEQFHNELNISELKKYGVAPTFEKANLNALKTYTEVLKSKFDNKFGGTKKAPKFPMPSIWKFLLYANSVLKDDEITTHLELTLDEICKGGIYDQIGGGFARYSVDAQWFAPHFEKMLYDNGQLVSLYAEAYKVHPKELYKEVVYNSISFLKNELMDSSGGFYSALDADSEGKEGEYYVWKAEELREVLAQDYPLIAEFYGVTDAGNWEHGKNILHLRDTPENFAKKKDLTPENWKNLLGKAQKQLLNHRQKRVRPGLDDKILAGWNGMMLKGLTDAYRVFNEPHFLKMAVENARFLTEKLFVDGQLHRNYKNGKPTIAAYLEDYAFVIDGLIGLYQSTFDEHWLKKAKELADYCFAYFFDETEKMFFYTASNSERLIARKKEIFDNVIPASNSQMAINLHLLSKYFYEEKYSDLARSMLANVKPFFDTDISYLANWAILYFYNISETAEVAIIGDKINEWRMAFDKQKFFNITLSGTANNSDIPVLSGRRQVGNRPTIYVCYNKSCKLPVHSVEEAIKQINFES